MFKSSVTSDCREMSDTCGLIGEEEYIPRGRSSQRTPPVGRRSSARTRRTPDRLAGFEVESRGVRSGRGERATAADFWSPSGSRAVQGSTQPAVTLTEETVGNSDVEDEVSNFSQVVVHGETETGNYVDRELHFSVEISSDEESELGDEEATLMERVSTQHRAEQAPVLLVAVPQQDTLPVWEERGVPQDGDREETEEEHYEAAQEFGNLADRLDAQVPGPRPLQPDDGVMGGWESIDRLGAWECYLSIFTTMEEVPHQYKAGWSMAWATVLEREAAAVTDLQQERALKWLCFLSQRLLRMARRGGRSGRGAVNQRFAALAVGDCHRASG